MIPKMTDSNMMVAIKMMVDKKQSIQHTEEWRKFFSRVESELEKRRQNMSIEHIVECVYSLSLAGFGGKS